MGEIENFVSSLSVARGLVIGKAPVRTTENRARMYMYVHVCMYVCMNRWMKECMNVKQKQLCNATKLF